MKVKRTEKIIYIQSHIGFTSTCSLQVIRMQTLSVDHTYDPHQSESGGFGRLTFYNPKRGVNQRTGGKYIGMHFFLTNIQFLRFIREHWYVLGMQLQKTYVQK